MGEKNQKQAVQLSHENKDIVVPKAKLQLLRDGDRESKIGFSSMTLLVRFTRITSRQWKLQNPAWIVFRTEGAGAGVPGV